MTPLVVVVFDLGDSMIGCSPTEMFDLAVMMVVGVDRRAPVFVITLIV